MVCSYSWAKLDVERPAKSIIYLKRRNDMGVKMTNARQKGNVVGTAVRLSKGLMGDVELLNARHAAACSALERIHMESREILLNNASQTIFTVLQMAVSDMGVSMRKTLMRINDKGKLVTRAPLGIKGLSELQQAKLIGTQINTVSLWGGLAYETDPTTYVLTPIGEKVVKLLVSFRTRRKEGRERRARSKP